MKSIKSKENKVYKETTKLKKKKYRDEKGIYLLEGLKPLYDAIRFGSKVETIFISESHYSKIDYEKLAQIGENNIIVLSDHLFAPLVETENSQGCISVVKKNEKTLDEAIEFAKEYKEPRSGDITNKDKIIKFIILDGLQDPGNVGTIIRTAEATGYKLVITTSGCVDVYSSKVVRAAAGSLFRVPVVKILENKELIKKIKLLGIKIIATSLEATSNHYEEDFNQDHALVIGNEGNGVSNEMLEASDIKVKIPMQGEIESLNASVAAGILMYESFR